MTPGRTHAALLPYGVPPGPPTSATPSKVYKPGSRLANPTMPRASVTFAVRGAVRARDRPRCSGVGAIDELHADACRETAGEVVGLVAKTVESAHEEGALRRIDGAWHSELLIQEIPCRDFDEGNGQSFDCIYTFGRPNQGTGEGIVEWNEVQTFYSKGATVEGIRHGECGHEWGRIG
jgi:hypothetical protein